MGFQFRKSLMIAQGDCIGAGLKSPSTSVEPKDLKRMGGTIGSRITASFPEPDFPT